LIFISTELIESDFKILGISRRGTDTLMPEALGSCCSTWNLIFDDTAFSAAIAAKHMRAKREAVAITVNFLRFM
jgi:hypothetical protein